MNSHLRALSEAIGVSGKEDAVRKIVLSAIDGHASDIKIDPMGSVTGRKKASSADPLRETLRVMIAAHMDEVGFMLMGFDGDGLIRFTAIGGIDDRILPGMRVKIGDNHVPGVIVWTPIHKNREQAVVKMSNLRIDIGATSKDEAADRVKRGDRIAFDSQFVEGDTYLRGKSFDDRVGCALLIDLLQHEAPYPVEVLAAFTVQEEVGLRGAQVAAQTLKPDLAIVLENTAANDMPDPVDEPDEERDPAPQCRLGAGPVLTVMDPRLIVNPKLLAFVRRTAEKEGIAYQFKSILAGGTDGGSIHIANAGIPTAVISMPCRYLHRPSSVIHRRDYADVLKLVKAILHSVSKSDF